MFSFRKEKTRKENLDSDPVTEKQTEMQLNACPNSLCSWLYFCGLCVCECVYAHACMQMCKKMAQDSLAHFSAIGPTFSPRWPDLVRTSSFKTAIVSKALDLHHICTPQRLEDSNK